MLKKILPIFFILCLVFSLTVPCFAYTEVGGALVINNLGNVVDFTRVNSTGGYTANVISSFTVEADHRYALFCYSVPSQTASNTFQFLLTGNGINTNYELTNNNRYQTSPYIFSARSSNRVDIQFVTYVAGEYNMHFVYFVFEIDPSDNLSSVIDLVNRFDIDVTRDYSRGSHTFFMDGFTGEEIPEFLSSTLHTFDFLGLSTVPYIPLLIVFFGITAILTFIFVIVFMIKRLTGGS